MEGLQNISDFVAEDWQFSSNKITEIGIDVNIRLTSMYATLLDC